MNLLKNLLKAILTIAVLSACNSKDNPTVSPMANPTTTPPASEEGGISSGGGGTLPANPISTYEVYKMIPQVKQELRMFISYKRYFEDKPIIDSEKFFFGDKNLATVLEETDLEILEDKACQDKNGTEVDASIYASKPNAICLSAFRIAPKLIKERAKIEIEALIMHELSHLLGATEAEAVEMQKYSSFYFGRAKNDDLDLYLRGLPYEVESLSSLASDLRKSAGERTPEELSKSTDELLTKMIDFDKNAFRLPFALWDFKGNDYFSLQLEKVRMSSIFADSLKSGNVGDYAKEFYDKAFQGQDEVTLEQLATNLDQSFLSKNVFKDEKIKRIKNVEDLKSQMSELKTYFSELYLVARALSYNQPMPELSGPWNRNEPNPWIQFAGKYEVVGRSCQHDWDHEPYVSTIEKLEIKIDEVDSTHTWLTTYIPNGYFTNPIWRNAFDAIKIHGDQNSASFSKERGNRWYDSSDISGWTKNTTTIQNKDGKLVYIDRSDSYKAKKDGAQSNYTECIYELKKTN